MGDGIMKRKLLTIIAACLLFSGFASAGDAEGGVNIEPVIEETIFSEITHTETTTDLEPWNITLTLNDDAYNNNTTFILTTQICNNEGVCLQPEDATLESSDNKTFTSSVMTIDDHSYVNWRITANYTSDNGTEEKFPKSKYYKTWSDCWLYEGEWGGTACEGDAKTESESDDMPAIGLMATITMVAIAAAFIRVE